MKKFVTKTMLALGVAATVMTGAITPTMAAPLATNSMAVKEAAPTDDVTQVRRWYRGWGGAVLGIGALALAYEAGRRHRHHRNYYYGGYPAYGYGYGYGSNCIRHRGGVYCR